MRKVIVLQARLNSNKLSEKVLLPLSGRPVIWHILERLRRCRAIDDICVATALDRSDDKLVGLCESYGVRAIRGSEDMLTRYIEAAYATDAGIVVRASGDDPLVHPAGVDEQVSYIEAHPDCDYVFQGDLPLGAMVETISRKALEKLDYVSRESSYRKHVTFYLHAKRGSHGFNMTDLPVDPALRHPEMRLTLETEEDYKVVSKIYDALYREGEVIELNRAIAFLHDNPNIRDINKYIVQAPSIRILENVVQG